MDNPRTENDSKIIYQDCLPQCAMSVNVNITGTYPFVDTTRKIFTSMISDLVDHVEICWDTTS